MVQNYVTHTAINMRKDPRFGEIFIQDLIAQDPSVLGLGELTLKDKERRQNRAGRLDLLLQDPETFRRYEVEVQLGPTDESHIIRTLEYWDIERKLYPQYEHCAVIVAEEITARFLNVISLFNGAIPLIAIKMQTIQVGDATTVVFTKVLDEVRRGLVDEDEIVSGPTVDRAFWEQNAGPEIVRVADKILEMLVQIDGAISLSFTKHYIGLKHAGQPALFVIFERRKNAALLEIRLPDSDGTRAALEESGLVLLPYDRHFGRYRIRVTSAEVDQNVDLIKQLLRAAYDEEMK